MSPQLVQIWGVCLQTQALCQIPRREKLPQKRTRAPPVSAFVSAHPFSPTRASPVPVSGGGLRVCSLSVPPPANDVLPRRHVWHLDLIHNRNIPPIAKQSAIFQQRIIIFQQQFSVLTTFPKEKIEKKVDIYVAICYALVWQHPSPCLPLAQSGKFSWWDLQNVPLEGRIRRSGSPPPPGCLSHQPS